MSEDTYKIETGEDKAWRELSGLDPDAVSASSLASYDPAAGVYFLRIFGEDFAIDPSARTVRNLSNPGRPHEYLLSLCTPAYLAGARPIPPSGEFVKEFEGGDFFFRGAHTLPLEEIAEKYGTDCEGFARACRSELGGEGAGLGDCGFRFRAYPRVEMAVLLWLEDSEFPARATLLFDSNAGAHMALDVVWAVALVACQRLLK